jgi:REP element-mobilizing transposase RayT
MANTYTQLIYHIVFSTKNRKPLIHQSLQKDLYSYIGGIIRNANAILIEIGGMPDHIHIVAGMKPTHQISDAVKVIKAKSSKWINEKTNFQDKFSWQTGYGAFSVSVSQFQTVRHYVAHQKEHHRATTFQEEFVALLKKHHIQYDEKYLWG